MRLNVIAGLNAQILCITNDKFWLFKAEKLLYLYIISISY